MAWTAATSQALVQTARDKLLIAEKAMFSYILVNNPGKLAEAQAAITAVTAAITALTA